MNTLGLKDFLYKVREIEGVCVRVVDANCDRIWES